MGSTPIGSTERIFMAWSIEMGEQGEEADYKGLIPLIKNLIPSFDPIEISRTPHAGILYIHFYIKPEELPKFCDLALKAHIHVSVHCIDNQIAYRIGTNNDEYFWGILQNESEIVLS